VTLLTRYAERHPSFDGVKKWKNKGPMDFRKVIREHIRHESENASVAGDVNAVVSANIGRKSSRTTVSSRQRVVQRSHKRSGPEPNQSSGGSDEPARGAD
jgi:hypothetical protein